LDWSRALKCAARVVAVDGSWEAIDLGVGLHWGFRAGTEIPLCETVLTLTTHTAAQLFKKLAKDCGRH
jgi:hypothetical protein